MRRSIPLLSALWLCAAPPGTAYAQPAAAQLNPAVEAKLLAADDAFRRQDYDRAIALLDPLVTGGGIANPARLHVAEERLGASYWFIGAMDGARLTFSGLLKADPDHTLDPLYYPQELISFFEGEKVRLKKLGFIGTPTGVEPQPGQPRLRLVRTVTERRMPTFAYLMPFAVGQFANGDPAKGTALAVLQGIGLATNVAAWIAIETMKKGGTNLIAEGQAGQAELLQILWWVGSGIFVASYGYSVVDGFVFRPPEHEERQRFELVEPDELPGAESSGGAQWRLGPAAAGLGLGIGGSF